MTGTFSEDGNTLIVCTESCRAMVRLGNRIWM